MLLCFASMFVHHHMWPLTKVVIYSSVPFNRKKKLSASAIMGILLDTTRRGEKNREKTTTIVGMIISLCTHCLEIACYRVQLLYVTITIPGINLCAMTDGSKRNGHLCTVDRMLN